MVKDAFCDMLNTLAHPGFMYLHQKGMVPQMSHEEELQSNVEDEECYPGTRSVSVTQPLIRLQLPQVLYHTANANINCGF